VLDHWKLLLSSNLSSGGVSSNTISEGEHIFKLFVLKSVRINVNQSFPVSKSTLYKVSVGLGWWVGNQGEEVFLDSLTRVDILEGSDFDSIFLSINFNEFPSKVNVNVSLVAFVKYEFVGIREFEDFFVWSPELDASVLGCSLLELVKSENMFIIEGIEIGTFSFVWELRSIADHISVRVEPSVVVVSLNQSGLVINLMHKDSVFSSVVFMFVQTLNEFS
jgi:hypothetical protein